MNNKSFEFKIGVIGLGYVGTPLACLFSKKYDTWGYDINAAKVAKLARKQGAEDRMLSKADLRHQRLERLQCIHHSCTDTGKQVEQT